MSDRSRATGTWLTCGAVLLAGVVLRAWILSSPLGEVEADESVVGLMALHILAGEHSAFYWGQPYLGSLEAYFVAAAFAAAGPSNTLLKLVPGLAYLVFAVLVFLGARRDYGNRVGLLSLLYLALPPSFLALWSLKARGGYMELLAIGQVLVFIAPCVARRAVSLPLKTALAGCLGGLLLWIHVLGLVYVVPVALYLILRLGRRLLIAPLLAGLAGTVVGLVPAIVHNAHHNWETLRALGAGGSSQQAFQDNLAALAAVGLPVMVGLGQATSSPLLFAQDWPQRPGSWPWVPPTVLALAAVALLPSLPALLAPLHGRRAERQATAFFGLGLLLFTPLIASLGRFGELVAEPRYALPLYGAVPLFASAVSAVRLRLLRVLALLLVLAINFYSLSTADPRLGLPTTAAGSTQANRAELIDYLKASGLSEIYTDYWLAYPVMFESREAILASVSSGGYNRFAPYAYFVSISPNPGFVFVAGSAEHADFDRRLAATAGRAFHQTVSIYEVYSSVEPLDPLRP